MPDISLSDAIWKYNGIEAAIDNALRNEVAEVVRGAIADAALESVYNAYTPTFLSRRDPTHGGGFTSAARAGHGITDPESIEIDVRDNELVARDIADWQHLWGGQKPSGRLAEAIATGDPRYNMEKAGPRPFHDTAKQIAIDSGEVERALRRGLERQGIDTSGMKFKIT